MMRFAARMAWRETRAAWRQFVGFFACVALGVAALASVGTLGANLQRTLGREAKSLLGGDVEVRSTRPIDHEIESDVSRLQAEGAVVTRVQEMVGMARSAADGRTLLVELKAVDARYPLYGVVDTMPAKPLESLLDDGGVIVEESLLSRLALGIGDRVEIGATAFTIRGIVRREPDRPASVVSLGPRILLSPASFARTGLVRVGSRLRHRVLLRLPESVGARPARDVLAAAASGVAVRVVTFDDAQPGLRRFFAQLTTYLGLVGLVSLLVGGIGVASAVSTFLRRRRNTIAVLKCLGADSRVLLLTYLLQTQVLGLLGSMTGAAMGVAVQPLLVRVLAGIVPFALGSRPEPATILRAVTMGVATTLLCALWPLLGIRDVRPSAILRSDVEPIPRRRPWLVIVPLGAGLAALAVWQAGSLVVGAIFVGACAAALALLAGLAYIVRRAARALRTVRGLEWRYGLANLHRPGGHTAVVIVALGVAMMLLEGVALLERSLSRQLDYEQRREAPSFFFIDLQPDQREAFADIVTRASGSAVQLTPLVRSRLAAVDGVPVTRDMVDRRRGGRHDDRTWYLTRDYVLTSAASPPANNVIVGGRWWTETEAAERPRISVEEDAAASLHVGVGSRLAFDVQGVVIEAEVMSIRRVDWQSFSTNFFVIFSQGALAGAPTTYVATARVPRSSENVLQDNVVAAFPNVTAIPVRDVLERLGAVLDQLALAIRVIALFSIAAGLVVMVGALTASRYQRLYESVILRTVGATRATVARTFAVEYGCLGAAAGLGGSVLAMLLAWIVLRFVLSVRWTFEPAALLLGVALTVLLALGVGFLATFRLLGARPLVVLRQE